MAAATDPAQQANIEYFFRLLYDCLRGACYGHADASSLLALLAQLWLLITDLAYLIAVIALIFIIYSTFRIFELRKREAEFYNTILPATEGETGEHPKWTHIKALSEGTSESGWREAIIEADILLDETLTNAGYVGENVGEKLKTVDRLHMASLNDAWEAHKVRNQIAHEGSNFKLTPEFTRRTIAQYESVFKEFKVI